MNASGSVETLGLDEAVFHWQSGRRAEAEAICRRILRARPNDPSAMHLLGCLTLASPVLAAAFLRKAVSLDPGVASYHNSLGLARLDLGQTTEALASFGEALSLDPTFTAARVNLGVAHLLGGEHGAALECFERAQWIPEDRADVHVHLGVALLGLSRPDLAELSFERARAQEEIRLGAPGSASPGPGAPNVPALVISASHLLFALHYLPTCTRETLSAAARAWGAWYARRFAGEAHPYPNDPDPERRLRIGYVSADFRRHPVGYFLEAALEARDPEQAEVFAYTNNPGGDDLTARLRGATDHWRDLVGLSDAEAAALIRRDAIDVLVDLSGHTLGNRLGVFARKPAPVQATWLGYFDTIGLSAIDYLIADRFVCPEDDDDLYVEKVIRLPETYLCYTPQSESVVAPPPSLASGRITFGCFNKVAKITPAVVALWAAILRALPTARLCLKDTAFDAASARARYTRAFAEQGVAGERLSFLGRTPYAEHLQAYAGIDLALDPFPFNGGTTTVEALWMGVPVIALEGDHFVSRMGVSHLHGVGLGDLVAPTEDAYLERAVELANDLPQLADLRRSLRQRMRGSSLGDRVRFTGGLEAAYRKMWRAWCQTVL